MVGHLRPGGRVQARRTGTAGDPWVAGRIGIYGPGRLPRSVACAEHSTRRWVGRASGRDRMDFGNSALAEAVDDILAQSGCSEARSAAADRDLAEAASTSKRCRRVITFLGHVPNRRTICGEALARLSNGEASELLPTRIGCGPDVADLEVGRPHERKAVPARRNDQALHHAAGALDAQLGKVGTRKAPRPSQRPPQVIDGPPRSPPGQAVALGLPPAKLHPIMKQAVAARPRHDQADRSGRSRGRGWVCAGRLTSWERGPTLTDFAQFGIRTQTCEDRIDLSQRGPARYER